MPLMLRTPTVLMISESMYIGNPLILTQSRNVSQIFWHAGSQVCMDPLCWKTSGLGCFWRGAFASCEGDCLLRLSHASTYCVMPVWACRKSCDIPVEFSLLWKVWGLNSLNFPYKFIHFMKSINLLNYFIELQ